MLAKFVPATLLGLAAIVATAHAPWPTPAPITGPAALSPTNPAALTGPAVSTTAVDPARPAAADDYRMNIQDGVTADAYNLVPLAEHDAARTRSMIDGIAGRRSTRSAAPADSDTVNAQATGLLPRPVTAAWWLAGLMAAVLMVFRRRR
jgi:hypothetical protein